MRENYDAASLRETVDRIYDGLKLNSFKTLGFEDEPMFDRPLMGIAAGDDEYIAFLKEHIGPFHWSPAEAFVLKYGDMPELSSLRVISFAFPQTKTTISMQQSAKVFPCDRWVVSRGEWEPMMQEFSGALEAEFERNKIRSASIDLRSEFCREDSENLGIASRWSHRHYAYAAGLGTFGLNDGFITERGIAVRLTSIVAEADFEITSREGRGPYDWCTFCGACIKRCPIGAITEKGHNKEACLDYEDEAIAEYWPEHIDRKDYIFGCGICQAGVPCSYQRP